VLTGTAYLPWLLAIALVASPEVLAREVKLQAEPMTLLARSMATADALARWDFADTLLDVLIDTYQDELATAFDENLTSPSRKAKLARWQAATALLMEDLVDARLLLSEGAPFDIQVDSTDQVLLFVDQKPIAFSAPRPDTEATMTRRVVEDYCSRNDCTVVDARDRVARGDTPQATGNWLLRQGRLPTYEVGSTLRCRFPDLSQRARKAQACMLAAADIDDLRAAIASATRRGYAVDWAQLAKRRQRTGMEIAIPLVEGGRFVRLTFRLITRLDDRAWIDLVGALQEREASETPIPVDIEGLSLLDAFGR
jgi:hypothetical protein